MSVLPFEARLYLAVIVVCSLIAAILASVLFKFADRLGGNLQLWVVAILAPVALSAAVATQLFRVVPPSLESPASQPALPSPTPSPASTSVGSDRRLIYEADFDQWTGTSDECSAKFYFSPSQEFHLRSVCAGPMVSTLAVRHFLDFDLEVTARKVTGGDRGWYGVVVVAKKGAPDEEQHLFFISGIRNYAYHRMRYDRTTTTVHEYRTEAGPEYAIAIVPRNGANHLRLIRNGSNLHFLVNGETLWRGATSLTESEAVELGIAVRALEENGGARLETAFSKLVVYSPA